MHCRRGKAEEDSEEEDDEVDDFFEASMYGLAVSGVDSNPVARVWLREGEYDGDDLVLGRYLETLERPEGMDDQRFEFVGDSTDTCTNSELSKSALAFTFPTPCSVLANCQK